MTRSAIALIVSILMLTLTPSLSAAAEKIEVSFAYRPGTTYQIEQSSDYDMTMKLENPSAAPEAVRERFPLSIDFRSRRSMSIATGAVAENGSFPVDLEVRKGDEVVSINGEFPRRMDTGLEKLIGLRAHGTFDRKGNLQLGTVEGKELSDQERKVIGSTLEQIVNSLGQLGTRSVAVGESFTRKTPVNVQIPGVTTIGMDMTTVYRLVRITGKLAEFETTSSFTMAASLESDSAAKLEATGEGKGSLVYDLEKKGAVKETDLSNMRLVFPSEHGKIIMTAKGSDSRTTEIQVQGASGGVGRAGAPL